MGIDIGRTVVPSVESRAMTLAIGARIGCPSPLLRPIRKPLTLARLPAILRPMRFASRTVALLRTALCTHRDLLFEILALRHQLGGLSRSHRRFRTSDRLFWLCLRRVWPGWREALVLVQPATVDRWHREGFRGWWRRHSRRQSGRPRIDSQLRSLIGRMATANGLWGAPRIHGELLKLGFTVSERTVSRSARPTDETVPDLADIPREPHRHPGVHFDGDVVVRDER